MPGKKLPDPDHNKTIKNTQAHIKYIIGWSYKTRSQGDTGKWWEEEAAPKKTRAEQRNTASEIIEKATPRPTLL